MAYNYKMKIIIVGDANVGKSCIASRFQYNKFDPNYEVTIGVEFFSKIIEINNNKVKVQIWDTAGQETFDALIRSYFRDVDGCVLTFDLSNRRSFINIEKWINKVKEESNRKISFILVGNKVDRLQERCICYEEAVAFSKKYKMEYVETSALNSRNIYNLFNILAIDILDNFIKYGYYDSNNVVLKESKKRKEEYCC
jgi:Ras-related protein Rab-2A